MSKQDEHEYRIRQLERQVKGMQRTMGVLNARVEVNNNRTERRLRDLEIKDAVQKGVPQRQVAKIFDLSAGRVSQIVKKVA